MTFSLTITSFGWKKSSVKPISFLLEFQFNRNLDLAQEDDYNYDDYADAEYDDGYGLGDITDKQTDYTDLLLGDDVPEEELEGLISEIISLRSIDEDEFYDLARTEGTQAALERFMKRQYSRKKLGRKLTEEEKEQRKKNQMHVPNWEVDIF